MKHTPQSSIRHATARRAVYAIHAMVLAMAVTGCGGAAPLFTSDGRPTTLVQCPAQGSESACMENARGMCAGDFDVVQKSTDKGMRNVLFACKAR